MHMKHVSLRGGRFGIQLHEIVDQFKGVIPWIGRIDGLQFATNGAYVKDELHRRFEIGEDGIIAFQFVTDDRSREFVGGLLSFAQTPERLVDPRNLALVQKLEADGARYISCLQIRSAHRGDGNGTVLMLRAVHAILRDYGAVWGVVSNPELLRWYRELGAETPSPVDSHDNLWIVTWQR